MYFHQLIKKGDSVAIVAPSGKISSADLDITIEVLESWGLKVILGKNVYCQYQNFAGTDAERISDLQWALDDPQINVILCARGGYGLSRIIDDLSLKRFKSTPKWVIGYSDITALLLKLQSIGIASIHGPMATSFNMKKDQEAIKALKSLLFEGISSLDSMKSIQPGLKANYVVDAEITGGNLSLLIDSLGTDNEVNTAGKILFIEEIGEKLYKIDRMFRHLKRANKLTHLAGLIIGQFSEINNGPEAENKSVEEIIISTLGKVSYPLRFGFTFGHDPVNLPIVVGANYLLKTNSTSTTLMWRHPNLEDQSKDQAS